MIWGSSLVRAVLVRGPHAQAHDLWGEEPGRPESRSMGLSRCQEQSRRGGLEKGQRPPYHVSYVSLLWLL